MIAHSEMLIANDTVSIAEVGEIIDESASISGRESTDV